MTHLEPKQLGQRIRLAREKKGLSQRRLAEIVDRDQTAISEIERGNRGVDASDLPKFADALDVSLLYFYGDDLSARDIENEILKQFEHLPDRESRETVLKIVTLLAELLNRPPRTG